jgi:hypothetical protein
MSLKAVMTADVGPNEMPVRDESSIYVSSVWHLTFNTAVMFSFAR